MKSSANAISLFIVSVLHTVSVFADQTQETGAQTDLEPVQLNYVSTVDSPAPHQPFDWFSREALLALPENSRPEITGVCNGVYVAPQIGNGIPSSPESAAIEATADHYEANGDGNIILSGDVIIQQGNRQLESDQIKINQHTRETQLEGNVRIRQQGMLMAGEKADLNLNQKSLSLKEADYVVHESRARGTASHIYNENETTLVFEESSYTTCEPNDNAWLFEADHIRLNQDSGWGTAKHAVVRVKDVPVFYFPWMMFPIDDRRQSGFLFPSFGSGEDNGTTVALPYYINIAPNYDATLTPRHMTERGTQLEGEFRYLTPYGKGELGAAYLNADQSYNDESRRLGIWKHSGYFSRDWYAKVDYTRVGDDDYFEDLATSLNAKSRTHLQQRADLGYKGVNLRGNLRIQHYQTLDEVILDEDLPYRKVPQFTLDGDWPLAQNSRFYGLWESEATRFEHPEDDYMGITEADRITLSPGLEYRYRKPWAHITPRIRFIHSDYNFKSDDASLDLDEDQSLYTASLDARWFFERPITVGDTGFTQTLEPRFFYLYTPFEEQNHRETFDSGRINFDFNQLFRENRFTGGDRFGDANQASLGLTTRFINRKTGWEQFRASMGQIFYFEDREVQLNTTDNPETESRSAWVGQTQWRISERWLMSTDLQWNESANNIDRGAASLVYRDPNGALLNTSYRYLDNGAFNDTETDKIKQTDLSFVWPANHHWSLIGRWGYDHEYQRSFENLIGVEYDSCCWNVRLVNRRYLKESSDDPFDVEPQRGIFLQFQLKGLGGVGNELDGILNESIRGFEYRDQLQSDIY